MADPVLFFGTARTGSSFIVGSIGRLPEVLAHGEPFQNEHLDWHFHKLLLPKVDLEFRQRAPYEFVRWVYEQSFGHRFVALKVLLGQSDEVLWRLLKDKDVRKIYLRRPNRLAHFASFKLAYKTNVWNVNRGEHVETDTKVLFDHAEFAKFVTWQDNVDAKVNAIEQEMGRNFLTSNYVPERLAISARDVARWLDLEWSDDRVSPLIRLHKNRVVERFSNRDEVLSALEQINKPDWADE